MALVSEGHDLWLRAGRGCCQISMMSLTYSVGAKHAVSPGGTPGLAARTVLRPYAG